MFFNHFLFCTFLLETCHSLVFFFPTFSKIFPNFSKALRNSCSLRSSFKATSSVTTSWIVSRRWGPGNLRRGSGGRRFFFFIFLLRFLLLIFFSVFFSLRFDVSFFLLSFWLLFADFFPVWKRHKPNSFEKQTFVALKGYLHTFQMQRVCKNDTNKIPTYQNM